MASIPDRRVSVDKSGRGMEFRAFIPIRIPFPSFATASWLWEMARRDALERYFHPPLTDEGRVQADGEGCIFGIA